jgi:hypothetical protein
MAPQQAVTQCIEITGFYAESLAAFGDDIGKRRMRATDYRATDRQTF